jgi:hypothetical protein
VGVLEDLAELAGYNLAIDIYGGLRPDVSRLHRTARSVLVADAKATEHPEDAETQARLLRYLHAARRWDRVGFVVAMGICHGADPARRWLRSVESLVAMAECSVLRSTYADIAADTAVSMVSFRQRR